MADVLLQFDSSSTSAPTCLAFTDIPAPQDVRIVVAVATGAGATACSDANDLFQALQARLAVWGSTVSVACGGHYHGTGCCMADTTQAAHRDVNILVVMEDPSVDFDAGTVTHFLALPNSTVIPIAPAGGRPTPSPAVTRQILFPYAKVEDAVPEVLLAGAIGEDSLAVFVSYSHADSAQVAGQIFHALAEHRFAVFLDRFRGTPGQNFVPLIMAELFNKGCLVVVEGPTTHRSPWVQAEVATATLHHLGIAKINLPGSPDMLPAQHKLTLGGRAATPAAALTDRQLDDVVSFVRGNLAGLGARRRAWLDRTFAAACTAVSILSVTQAQDRSWHVSNNRGRTYRVLLSARPPGATSFRDAHSAMPGTHPVVIGPLVNQLPGAALETAWLGLVSGVRAVDEGALVPAAQAMAGNLL